MQSRSLLHSCRNRSADLVSHYSFCRPQRGCRRHHAKAYLTVIVCRPTDFVLACLRVNASCGVLSSAHKRPCACDLSLCTATSCCLLVTTQRAEPWTIAVMFCGEMKCAVRVHSRTPHSQQFRAGCFGIAMGILNCNPRSGPISPGHLHGFRTHSSWLDFGA